MKYILASKSPRRRELLGRIIPEFDIITKDVDETLPEGMHPQDGVVLLAERKGAAIAKAKEDSVVISSDTLVELDGAALGKPIDTEDAVSTLLSLSGRSHNVHTGVAVHYKGRVFSGTDSASVRFKSFDETEAREYVATGEPMDKAGSYAIQGIGNRLVEGYDGEFETIVGLSLKLTKKLIDEALGNE